MNITCAERAAVTAPHGMVTCPHDSEVFFDAERAMHVAESMDEVIRRLEEALQ